MVDITINGFALYAKKKLLHVTLSVEIARNKETIVNMCFADISITLSGKESPRSCITAYLGKYLDRIPGSYHTEISNILLGKLEKLILRKAKEASEYLLQNREGTYKLNQW